MVLGTTRPLDLVLMGNAGRKQKGVVKLAPSEVHVWSRRIMVGGPDLSTITDAVYALREQPTGRLEGRLVDSEGAGVPGVAVAAIAADDHTQTRFITDADGRFAGTLPLGTVTLQPDPTDRVVVVAPSVAIVADETTQVEPVVAPHDEDGLFGEARPLQADDVEAILMDGGLKVVGRKADMASIDRCILATPKKT